MSSADLLFVFHGERMPIFKHNEHKDKEFKIILYLQMFFLIITITVKTMSDIKRTFFFFLSVEILDFSVKLQDSHKTNVYILWFS